MDSKRAVDSKQAVLGEKLPSELAEHIVRLAHEEAACTRLQAALRGMVARMTREPLADANFERVAPWTYPDAPPGAGPTYHTWQLRW